MSNSKLFDGVVVFVAVVKTRSFTAAAQTLGRSTPYVSKEVSKLENRLGVRLLNRTTRTLSLTDAGRAYFERVNQIIIDTENVEQSIGELQETPRGLLRVNVPVSFGLRYLGDLLAEFMQTYPELDVEVEFNDRMINVVEEGFDVVIRIGDTKDSSLVARKFSSTKRVTVASPAYLDKYGRPEKAKDLQQHTCIGYNLINNPTVWEYNKGFEKVRVQLEPKLMCNSAELETAMVLQGAGITRLPYYCVEEHVQRGELELVLNNYAQPDLGIFAVYPHRQFLSTKVRAFVDYLVKTYATTKHIKPAY